jgi:plasminogen activator inhibitor 1 RNA-binding protein
VLGEDDGKPQKKKVEKKEVKAPTKKPIPSTAIIAAVSSEIPSEKPFAGRGPLQDTRGGRGGRGRGRGRGGRPPKRDSDRVSGTGRGREVRKGGAGGYAAEGTMTDDLAAQSTPAVEAVPEVEDVVPELTEEQKEAALKKQQEEEEEAKKITFDQFLAKEKEKTVKDDQNRILREVTIDEKKFKSGKVIAKGKKDIGTTLYEKEDPFANKDDKENKDKKKSDDKSSNKKQKLNLFEFKEKTASAVVPVAVTSTESQQPFIQAGPRTSRGGRGAGRGTRGAGRGAGRGGAVRGPRVKLEDMDSFPKLGLAK